MLIDARTLSDNSKIEADLCVIGAGPAGLAIAKGLSDTGLRTVLLESGGEDFDEGVNALSQGEYTGLEIEPLEATRVRGLGGTSTIWSGDCRMLDPNDFEHRPWVAHSGWPFGIDELAPHYAKANEIITHDDAGYDFATWAARTGNAYLEFDDDTIFHRITLTRALDFWREYAADLENSDDTTVFTFATVLAIRTMADGKSVERLDVTSPANNRFTVRAKQFVLACGAIENARLLLLSNDVHANGLGNANDLVGRFFMEHPRFVAGMLLLSGDGVAPNFYIPTAVGGGAVRADLGIAAAVQEREQIGNVLLRMRPAAWDRPTEGSRAARHFFEDLRAAKFDRETFDNLKIAIRNIDDVADKAFERLSGGRSRPVDALEVTSYIEQIPNPDSRVVLSDSRDDFGQRQAHLIWTLSDFDKRSATRAAELLGQAAGAQGLGRVRIDVPLEEVFPESTDWGHHHMGTTRMSDDPKRGVVDSVCRVHDVSNLYIAGSSVFPTSGCATPTLTIVALASRLVDHLAMLYGVSRT